MLRYLVSGAGAIHGKFPLRQYFPNGAKLESNKNTGDTELLYKGECVGRWYNIKLCDMDTIQQLAAGLTAENLAMMVEIVRV